MADRDATGSPGPFPAGGPGPAPAEGSGPHAPPPRDPRPKVVLLYRANDASCRAALADLPAMGREFEIECAAVPIEEAEDLRPVHGAYLPAIFVHGVIVDRAGWDPEWIRTVLKFVKDYATDGFLPGEMDRLRAERKARPRATSNLMEWLAAVAVASVMSAPFVRRAEWRDWGPVNFLFFFFFASVAVLMATDLVRTAKKHPPDELAAAGFWAMAFGLASFLAFPLAALAAGRDARNLAVSVVALPLAVLGLVSTFVSVDRAEPSAVFLMAGLTNLLAILFGLLILTGAMKFG